MNADDIRKAVFPKGVPKAADPEHNDANDGHEVSENNDANAPEADVDGPGPAAEPVKKGMAMLKGWFS